jgi:metallophosphoesterase (TIGR03767 family)
MTPANPHLVPRPWTATLSRRRFLATVAAVAAATGLPPARVARALEGDAGSSAALTTVGRTLQAGNVLREGALGAYRAVTDGPGEPHVVRADFAAPQEGREERRRSLVHLLHLTDQHITDGQAPTRLEFVRDIERGCETTDLPAKSAHRSHETASTRIADAMNARARAITFSPITGAPLQAAITTGDNVDNAQANEIDAIIAVMNGDTVSFNSGDPTRYEGLQASGDPAYWHPDPEVDDVLKTDWGFPSVTGFLDDALEDYDAVGVGVPWYTCYGNHDALLQGNFPGDLNGLITGHLQGDQKLLGFPPLAPEVNQCLLFSLMLGVGGVRPLIEDSPQFEVTPDVDRMLADRRTFVQKHLASGGFPAGHGFTAAFNLGATEEDSRLYYRVDVGQVRWIVLDTTNPGGLPNGSIGTQQFTWLQAELEQADAERKLVLIFSHHGLESLDNGAELLSLVFPGDYGPNAIDPVRLLADPVEALLEQHPCVLAWISGHTHVNRIRPRAGFWDIGTAAHIDWPGQARLVEVVDNRDGTVSILCTMLDHEDEGDHALAGQARELMMNDPLGGWRGTSGTFGTGSGQPEDRNVELLLPNPYPAEPGPTERASSRRVAPPVASAGFSGALPSKLSIAGALAVGGAVGLARLRQRGSELQASAVSEERP